uniref:SWIM-type domain-containing protein n=1 Tax=Lactuca sativa TaxID=4236 RepID=A0A9R1US09_LACSA|nr:hypothetical protein LSAT_V11C800434430 [Lactuca sativa]
MMNLRKRMLKEHEQEGALFFWGSSCYTIFYGSRVKCKVDSTGGGPSTVGKLRSKGKTVISQKDSCLFAIQISRSTEEEQWLVKTVIHENLCLQSRNVKACTSRYLASTILQKVDSDPRIPVTAIQEELQMDLELSISKTEGSIAKEQLYGDYERQYNLLRDYCLDLQTNNPCTTVKLEVCNEPNPDMIYICLGALKLEFKYGKRELLGLDGCFLKGPHPGQILTVMGLDSNNGIYPLAYAVMEAEATGSWTWFLECLGGDLDLDASCNFTFVSDRKKFRDNLWRCATNATIRHFERAMNEFKDFTVEAHEWLSNIPRGHWARSHFTGRAHSNCLLNNLCEVFNSKLEHGRDKPIITCLEYIRVYLMKRHCIVQKEIDKCKSILTPTVTTILDTIKIAASKYRALFYGFGKYQVTGMMFDHYVVNLKEGTCSCRYWEITGIVCRHGICAIWEHIQNETWRAMYSNKIDPINGRSMWPKSRCPTTFIPPTHHTQVGRPKKKSRWAIDEPTNQSTSLSRKFLIVTYSKCHNKGHNSRTCKGQRGSSQRAVGGSSQGGVGRCKDAVGGTSQGSVGGSSQAVVGGLTAKKMDKGKKPQV